ncbi:MAG: hypothetical protein HDS10_07700 [Bacteroides sp.]|nr:hypothetical protein [Bacteroides sp.]
MGPSTSVAYVWAIVISLAFLLIAVIIANLISNKPGGKDVSQRRVWFWVCLVLALAVMLTVNLITAYGIHIPTRHSDYITATGLSTALGALIYVGLGMGLSKGMSRSKIGSWF